MKRRRRFKVIYVDPPWPETGGGRIKRGADRHYSVMRVEDIMSLPVENTAAKNSHLYLWVTNNFLWAAFSVLEAWGFRYVTTVTWTKDRIGLGQYFRGQTEHCIFAVRGILPYRVKSGKRQQGTTAIAAKRGRHSAKPDEMRRMIEKVSRGPYLELFAREKTRGWKVWGNEVKRDVELV